MANEILKAKAPIEVSILKTVLKQMYPIIGKANLSLELEWEESFDSYLVILKKGKLIKYFLLNREDAIGCIEGEVCIYFGVWLLHIAASNRTK